MYWTVTVEGGPSRVYHASVAIGSCIYTFGGRYCGNKVAPDKMEVHVLDTETLQSAAVPIANDVNDDTPMNLLGHTAVAHGRKVYIWGGYHSSPFRHMDPSVLWCFDTATRRWSQPETSGEVPVPRIHHTACVIGDCMFVIGGFERRFGLPMRVVQALSLTSMAWRVFPTSDASPQGGVYRSAVLTPLQGGTGPREGCSQICLFGGATARTLFPTGQDQRGIELFVKEAMKQLYGWKVSYLDATTGEWLSAASPYLPTLTGSSGFVYGSYLYMTMNGDSKFGQLGMLTRRCVDDNALEQVLPQGASRATQCLGSCVVVDDRVFFIGGTTPSPVVQGNDSFRKEKSSVLNGRNAKYEKLADHYGAVQVLDFRPNLQTMCIAVITKFDLHTSDLPLTLQNDVDLCTPRYRAVDELLVKKDQPLEPGVETSRQGMPHYF